ncbi:MAG: hypothetical protein KUG82_09570 [Pseudomonadales bacterium]|nr:hypothetical protein [Pseudomonadales bacterium]
MNNNKKFAPPLYEYEKATTNYPSTLFQNSHIEDSASANDIKRVLYILSREGKQCLCNLGILAHLPMDRLNVIVNGLDELGIVKRSKPENKENTDQVELCET